MCWNTEASVTFAIMGAVGVAWSIKKGQSPLLYVPLAYFVLMEILQALTYPVLNQCSLPQNEILTYLAYLHIAFQPFFFNAIGLYFVPPKVRARLCIPVGIICFVGMVIMLLRVIPLSWLETCDFGHLMCDAITCSVSGSWHMEWRVKLNTFFDSVPIYVLVVVILPFLYGSWKAALFSLILGVGVSWALSGSINELPAIWCLLSVGLIMLMVYTPLQKHLHVARWPLWPKSWKG